MSLIDINDAIERDRLSRFKPLVESNESILELVKGKQREWSEKLTAHELCNDPYIEQYRIHEKWMTANIDSVSQTQAMLMDYLNYCEELGVYGDEKFWSDQLFTKSEKGKAVELSEDIDIGLALLREQWSKEIGR